MVESSGPDHMTLLPGKTKSYSFSFVAKTEDVGKKIEVRLRVRERNGGSQDDLLVTVCRWVFPFR